MARGFGATLGGSAADEIASAYTTDLAQRSYSAKIYRRVDSVEHTIIKQGVNPTYAFYVDTTSNTYALYRMFSGTDINYKWVTGSTGVWHSIGFSYDQGATTNVPLFYLDGVAQSASFTQAPSGTADSVSGQALTIGAESGSDTKTLDGILAEVGVWSVLLTAAEFAALAKGYSPPLIRPSALVEYIPMVRSNVSYKLAAPTITGTVLQPHPRIIYPTSPMIGHNTGAAAATAPRLIGGILTQSKLIEGRLVA